MAEALEALFEEQDNAIEAELTEDISEDVEPDTVAEDEDATATERPIAESDLVDQEISDLAQLASEYYEAAEAAFKREYAPMVKIIRAALTEAQKSR